MQTAVTTALDREDFTRPYTVGRPGKLAELWRGSQASRKPALRLQAFPTAGGIPGNRRRQQLLPAKQKTRRIQVWLT